MAVWEDFEIDCTEYLNKSFGKYASFIRQGGTNSTVPDILVKTNKGRAFYIDVKYCPAQCGQFVLFPDVRTKTFEYSKSNYTRVNMHAQKIMNHMNTYFEDFKEAGTRGKEIILDDGTDTLAKWIISTYKDNGVKYFITNDYVIVPIDDFQRHFNVSAKYRIKRSGSSDIGKSCINEIINNIGCCGYAISETRTVGAKLFVKSQESLHNKRFIYQNNEYMFSLRNNEYEIRKLSNTFNANVIFSINKKLVSGLTQEQFAKEL